MYRALLVGFIFIFILCGGYGYGYGYRYIWSSVTRSCRMSETHTAKALLKKQQRCERPLDVVSKKYFVADALILCAVVSVACVRTLGGTTCVRHGSPSGGMPLTGVTCIRDTPPSPPHFRFYFSTRKKTSIVDVAAFGGLGDEIDRVGVPERRALYLFASLALLVCRRERRLRRVRFAYAHEHDSKKTKVHSSFCFDQPHKER